MRLLPASGGLAQAGELVVFVSDAGFHQGCGRCASITSASPPFGQGPLAHTVHDGLDARFVAHLGRVLLDPAAWVM